VSQSAGVEAVLGRLARVDTTSLVDAGGGLRVLPAGIRPIRPGLRLVGRAVTADARGDLLPVIDGLRRSGPGDVLVVAAGSTEHAVAGELFATEALRRGLAGIVIDGLCRDSRTLVTLDLPVYARGVVPTACPAQAVPQEQGPVTIGSVEVRPGDLVLGDDDGVVVGTEEELLEVLDVAEAIQRREEVLRAQIGGGSSLFDHLDFDRHLAAVRAGQASRLTFS
jgi:4-hydroxy-4-methyl-2-oxoglutarate aldolase